MPDIKPWDIEPDLTPERLAWVRRTFVAVRKDARETYDPAKGDNALLLGLTCFLRQKYAIAIAAANGSRPWLSVVNDSMKFIFKVGRVVARFYKGEAEHPSENLRRSFPELRQQPLLPI